MSGMTIAAILAGAGVGGGLWLIARQWMPSVPALGPALRQWHTSNPAVEQATLPRWLRMPRQELALIGYSPQRYLVEKLGFTAVGLVFAPLFTLVLLMSGIRLGWTIPAIVGVVLAAGLFFLVDVSIRQRAQAARTEFRRHVAVYLDLIALELAASRGPAEALERAAAVGGGWVSQRIRQALHNSRLRVQPPWDGLKQVADEIGVPDLGDVGDIMTLVSEEGAHVYDSLRSRAASLRAAMLAAEEERATTATTVLYIPTSMLVFVLFVIAAYPFLVRLIST